MRVRAIILRCRQHSILECRVASAIINWEGIRLPPLDQPNAGGCLIRELQQIVLCQLVLNAEVPIQNIGVTQIGIRTFGTTGSEVSADEWRSAIRSDV